MANLSVPVSDDAPSGTYLKETDKSKYRGLRNAFNAARSAYRSLTETPTTLGNPDLQDANEAAWQVLSEQAKEVLTQDTKDAEIFIWYAGSQVHLPNGLSKTIEALSQLTMVLETNWDTLNPRPSVEKLKAIDETGQTKEIAEGIAKVFFQLIGEVPGTGLLVPPLGDLPVFGEASYNEYMRAEANGTQELFNEEARTYAASAAEELTENLLLLRDLLETAEACGKVLGEKAHADGAQGVSFRFLTDHVNSIIGAMRHSLETTLVPWPLDKLEQPEAEDVTVAEGEDTETSNVGGARVASSFVNDRIASRQDAVSALEALARFFRETEPHSPIYLLLERAARWSRKDLPALYGELLGQDSSEMNRLTFLTGLESAGTVAKAPMSALDRFLGSNEHLLAKETPMDIPGSAGADEGAAMLSSAPTPPTPVIENNNESNEEETENNNESDEEETEVDSSIEGVVRIEW